MGFAPHWYSINSGVLFPIDEAAAARDDSGKLLPTNLLVDLSVRWPEDLGRYAFVSAIAVTRTLVTLLLQSSDDLNAAGFSPLASVNLPQPVQPGVAYPLDPHTGGVGGWVVFGAGVTERLPYQGRFSTPAQTRLAPRAARSYRRLPVASMQVAYAATKLSDVVLVRAETPLQIAKESREIDGVFRDVMVVRLVDSNSSNPVPAAQASALGLSSPSVFEQFAGPCGSRPESGTCGDPQPIQFIDAVGPDCDGTLIVRFTGCARISQILDTCGVIIDCGVGLTNACLPPEIPDDNGVLPSEFEPAVVPIPEIPIPVPVSESVGTSSSHSMLLPYLNCFSPGFVHDFRVEVGAWQGAADGTDPARPHGCANAFSGSSASYTHEFTLETATAATRNVTVWPDDATTVPRRITVGMRILGGPNGSKRNAGVVLNWRQHPKISDLFIYWMATLDYDTQQIQLQFFDGHTLSVVDDLVVPGIVVDRWYKMTVLIEQGALPAETVIQIHVLDVEKDTIEDTLTTVLMNFQPYTGNSGLGNNRGLARFSYFLVEDPNDP